MAGTYLGARLAVFFSGAAQLALFAVVMLLAACFMFRAAARPPGEREDGRAGKEMPLGLIVRRGRRRGRAHRAGGRGGGFLIVPALVLLGRVPMKQAVGTSLLVIAMNSAAGFIGLPGPGGGAVGLHGPLHRAWRSRGILVGTYLVRFVPQHALQRAFALFLVVMGGFILYQNRAVLSFGDPSAPEAAAVAGH